MGTREKIILLQVGEEQLLVGVSPGRINKLHVLNKAVTTSNTKSNSMNNDSVNSDSVNKGFAGKLKTLMTDAGVDNVNKKNK